MKIGILTYHSVYNFGANLQVYSTVGYLKNNGFDPIVINWMPADLEARSNRIVSPIQADAHNKFVKNYLPCTEICRTDSDIIKVIENEDIQVIINGSDAILQHKTFLSRINLSKKGITIGKNPGTDVLFPNPFWGSFISGLNRKIPIVIMSASTQNTEFYFIKGRLRKQMKKSLHKFTSISVRDSWTREMIKYLTEGEIVPQITPDPVFAYNQNIKEQYSKDEILKIFNLPENYILFSFRGPNVVSREWLNSFQLLAEKNKLSCVALTGPGGILFDHPFSLTVKSPLKPQEWYGLIKYSSAYIGEQMHPIIIALHNKIPFYSFDYYGIVRFKYFVNLGSSKIHDILSFAGFLKNSINMLGKGTRCPSPEVVFQKISEFDLSKCNLFRINQLERYNSMMKSVTESHFRAD
jgi:polysaccharide pyruvyl transferase WcaK-like protein